MRTEDITAMSYTGEWRREPSERINAALGKLAEEAGELASRCARCMIQGYEAVDPDDGRYNAEHLMDEIADVMACIQLLDQTLKFTHSERMHIAARAQRKAAIKTPWIEALPG